MDSFVSLEGTWTDESSLMVTDPEETKNFLTLPSVSVTEITPKAIQVD